jgi:3-oxoadipate enol-lactonase
MPFVQAGAASVYYEVHGSGPALVFAHGADGNTLTWYQQVAYFRDYYTVITFDSRGFGRSTCSPDALGTHLRMQDLEAVLNAEGIETAALVGHSLGGYSALPFALAYPERASCVVLAGSPAGVRLVGQDRATRRLFARFRRNLNPAECFLSGAFRRERPDMAMLFDQINQLNPAHDAASVSDEEGVAGSTLIEPEELKSFRTPTLAVASAEDPNYYVHEVAELAQLIGAKLVVIERAGHPAYFETPVAFNRAVHDFLQSHGWA